MNYLLDSMQFTTLESTINPPLEWAGVKDGQRFCFSFYYSSNGGLWRQLDRSDPFC